MKVGLCRAFPSTATKPGSIMHVGDLSPPLETYHAFSTVVVLKESICLAYIWSRSLGVQHCIEAATHTSGG